MYLLVIFLCEMCEMPPISKMAVLQVAVTDMSFLATLLNSSVSFCGILSSPGCMVRWDCNLGEMPSLSQALDSGLKVGQSHAPHQEFVS